LKVDIRPLSIDGAFVVTPVVHRDGRGEFVEWFRADLLQEATGMDFSVAQANFSISAKGTVRGIHYADVPPGQAKYVMCSAGSIRDYVVDIRVGSPTFGQWDAVDITARERNAIVLDVGLGHAFVALEENTTVTYLVTDHYKPHAEHAIAPLDIDIALDFPLHPATLLLSQKDSMAPGFATAQEQGMLPKWQGRVT
jgi:dTDP-4-dehydrorhamnose 3,5-epimerase